jgi:hypothetical protein
MWHCTRTHFLYNQPYTHFTCTLEHKFDVHCWEARAHISQAKIMTRDTRHSGDLCPNGHKMGRKLLEASAQVWCPLSLFLLVFMYHTHAKHSFSDLEIVLCMVFFYYTQFTLHTFLPMLFLAARNFGSCFVREIFG